MNFDPTELSWLTLLARHPLREDRAEFDPMLSPDGRVVAEVLQRLEQGQPTDGYDAKLVDLARALRDWASSTPETPSIAMSVTPKMLDDVRRVAEEEAW